MKLFSILINILVVVTLGQKLNRRDRKKLKRGVKIFGSEANPLSLESQCSCSASSNCWLVGDPHLKSFFNKLEKVQYPTGYEFNIYSHDDFIINATTYGPDIMDNIHFGDMHTWHIDDCNNTPGWLESKTHTYSDGSSVTARVYCRKVKNKMHVNLLLTKIASLKESLSFEEYEDFIESSGVCTHKR